MYIPRTRAVHCISYQKEEKSRISLKQHRMGEKFKLPLYLAISSGYLE